LKTLEVVGGNRRDRDAEFRGELGFIARKEREGLGDLGNGGCMARFKANPLSG